MDIYTINLFLTALAQKYNKNPATIKKLWETAHERRESANLFLSNRLGIDINEIVQLYEECEENIKKDISFINLVSDTFSENFKNKYNITDPDVIRAWMLEHLKNVPKYFLENKIPITFDSMRIGFTKFLSNDLKIPIEELNSIWRRIEKSTTELDHLNLIDEPQQQRIEQTFGEARHAGRDIFSAYGLKMYEDGTDIVKIRKEDGEKNFFLREVIKSYLKLKSEYHLDEGASVKFLYNLMFIPDIPFLTRKSPPGLILATYIYDDNTVVNTAKFSQVCKTGGVPVSAYAVIPLPLGLDYRVQANMLIRYAKLIYSLRHGRLPPLITESVLHGGRKTKKN